MSCVGFGRWTLNKWLTMAEAFAKFRVGAPGAGAAHASYITRYSALEPNGKRDHGSQLELIDHQMSVAAALDENLNDRALNDVNRADDADPVWTWTAPSYLTEGHYGPFIRPSLSELSTEIPSTRTYTSTCTPARLTGGRYIWARHQYASVDEKWAKIYSEFAGERSVYVQHLHKKEETRQWKIAAAEAYRNGQPIPPKPERDNDRRERLAEQRLSAQRSQAKDHGAQLKARPEVSRQAAWIGKRNQSSVSQGGRGS
jgi:hypothetical protein